MKVKLVQGLLAWIVVSCVACAASAAKAQGKIEAELDGAVVELPSLGIDVSADVRGDLATVTVVQTFANPHAEAMHAVYTFPLSETAAVYAMSLEVGRERIKAVVKEKEEARASFEAAKREGKAASLLTQHRPNVFTQEVANLMPGLPVKVELKYVQAVDKIDGAYQLVVPLVVGPRYEPKDTPKPERLPVYPKLVEDSDRSRASAEAAKRGVDSERVRFAMRVEAGMPVVDLQSPTHQLRVDETRTGGRVARFATGAARDDRDLIVRYRLAGPQVTAGLTAYRDERGGFFTLMIEPPRQASAADTMPREMVFLLDCSGSMNGLPLDASKLFMREALKGLRAGDSFRIIRFSDRANEFTTEPLMATPDNVARGLAYVETLNGEGGTEMAAGIRQALTAPERPGVLRLVMFLTDGYIGNEQEVLALVKSLRGEARLYAFGVGSGVNRYLMQKLGELGHGFTRYMDPTEDPAEVARSLALRLDAPVLTNLAIDWGGLDVTELAPATIPDVFAGHAVRIQGRYTKPGKHTITVSGDAGKKRATLPLDVTLPAATDTGHAIPLVWARAKVERLMDELTTPVDLRAGRRDDDTVRGEVTKLGTKFQLVTRWTAFVATSETIVNPDADGVKVAGVPLPQVKGVSKLAYAPTGAETSFAGSSTPEPEAFAGLFAVLLTYMVVTRLGRKARA